MRLLLLLILSLAFAVPDTTSTQRSFDTPRSPPLLRALQNMIALQQQSQQLDYGQLLNAVDELETSIQDAKEHEISAYEKDSLQHDADVAHYENLITQYKTEVAQHQIDLSDLTETRSGYEKLLSQALSEQTQTSDLRQQLVNQIKEDAANAAAQSKEYTDAIDAIDEALKLLEASKNSAFVEKKQFQSAQDQLATRFKKLKIFYHPIVSSMSQLAQSNFANQEMLSKVIKLLNDLRASLNESNTSLLTAAKGLEEKNQGILDTYDEKLRNLAEVVIPDLKEVINVKDGEIKTKQSLLNDANNNLQDALDNLAATENDWIKRQDQNNKLIKQYDTDLSIIQQVRQAFDRAGIKRRE